MRFSMFQVRQGIPTMMPACGHTCRCGGLSIHVNASKLYGSGIICIYCEKETIWIISSNKSSHTFLCPPTFNSIITEYHHYRFFVSRLAAEDSNHLARIPSRLLEKVNTYCKAPLVQVPLPSTAIKSKHHSTYGILLKGVWRMRALQRWKNTWLKQDQKRPSLRNLVDCITMGVFSI